MSTTYEKSMLGVHAGNILAMVSDTYPNMKDVVLEQVQNALDANAKMVVVRVNQRKRTVEVRDDGYGVTKDQFDKALREIGKTQKKRTKLGRFGRGVVSPLGKCDYFSLTSRSRTGSQYLEWTFDSKDILSKSNGIAVPCRLRNDIYFAKKDVKARKHQERVNWNTQVYIHKYTTDQFLSEMSGDQLATLIADKYRTTLLRTKTRVYVSFISNEGHEHVVEAKPQAFLGTPLPEVEYTEGSKRHAALFRVHVIPSSMGHSRKGKLLFGRRDNEFRINWRDFRANTRGLLSPESAEVLTSGCFEGEILTSAAELHPERNGFKKDDNLVNFCIAIETWCQEVGTKRVEEVVSQKREKRWQELGVRSMKVIEQLVKENPGLTRVLEGFRKGHIGTGHTDPNLPQKEREGKETATRGTPNSVSGRSGEYSADQAGRSDDPKERTGHRPYTVSGPRGSSRSQVTGNSLGLTLQFLPLETTYDVCHVDTKTGVVTINTRHRYWFECEKHDIALMRYIETVVPYGLSLCSIEDEEKLLQIEAVMESYLDCLVYNIRYGDVISGRRRAPMSKST